MVVIKRVSCIEELLDLSHIWNNMVDEDKYLDFSSRFEWIYNWLLCHKDSYKDIFILLAKENECIVGIAPCVVVEKRIFATKKINTIRFIGWNLSFYKDFIIKRQVESRYYMIINSFIEYIFSETDVQLIELNQIKEDSPTLPIINNLKDNKLIRSILIENKSIYLDISIFDGDFSRYWSSLNRGLRKNIRWIQNKGFTFCVATNKKDIMLYLENLFAFHTRRWKDSKYKKEKHKKFLYNITEEFSKEGILYLCGIYKNQLCAVALCYKYKNKLYYALPSFDISFEKFSPGKFLLFNIIKDSFESSSIKEVDLLVGEDEYKYWWAQNRRINYKIVILRRVLLSRLIYLVYYEIKPYLVRLKQKVKLMREMNKCKLH